MFERYTETARRALFFARYETAEAGAGTIDTEHMLLGVIRVGKGFARTVLTERGVSFEGVREEVGRRAADQPRTATSVEIPFSAGTHRVLHFAVEESDALGTCYIGTEHLLLGLLRETDSVAAAILRHHGLDIDGT